MAVRHTGKIVEAPLEYLNPGVYCTLTQLTNDNLKLKTSPQIHE